MIAAPPNAAGPVVATELPMQGAFWASTADGKSATAAAASQPELRDSLVDAMLNLSDIKPQRGDEG
ncbi:hypothetical protein ACIKTA_03460 [Hansschlegelia beijingensis]|uniref:Uncharacterized protein n=1 Tax=Hansschlegelia beijingensis TaxID=1133344 RepID=A0A7W6CXI6_9HYPH|nr:hypothetical protein [Hansschlegelia beijingensis]